MARILSHAAERRLAPIAIVAWVVLVAPSADLAAKAPTEQTLKEAFADDFLIGAALRTEQVQGHDPQALELVARQFNSITPENLLKWASVHPQPGEYRFEDVDRYVEFGQRHKMHIVGHNLVWHEQTPAWVFQDDAGRPLGREALLERLREHIHAVVGRYRGRIHGWDVVNEAIVTDPADDSVGQWRTTPWLEAIGPDYIEKAFQFAHEADPKAELYYNDYDEWKAGKRKLFAELVHRLRAQGIRVDGLGLQGHWRLDYPTVDELEPMFRDLSALDVKLMVTELDVNVLPMPWDNNVGADVSAKFAAQPEADPYRDGLPDRVQRKLANRYAAIFRLFRDHRDRIDRVTFWGVDDGHTWLNDWPVRGRTNYPLLFDRGGQPKLAFHAVLAVAKDRK